MTLFLLFFLSVYVCMHLYAFFRAKAALALSATTSIFVLAVMALMIAAPFIVRSLERHGHDLPARIAAYIGYIWLGILFLFCFYSLLFDLYRLFVYVAGLVSGKKLSLLLLSPRAFFVAALSFSLASAAYGYFEAWDIRTEKIEIRSTKVPAGIGRLRVVQISDLHVGLIIREKKTRKVAELVRKASPDILVSTGDLVDGNISCFDGITNLLSDINPRFGKYAVTGNHEFYAGMDQATCFTEKSGFRLIRGERIDIPGVLSIAGVDDPAGKRLGLVKDISEKELLSGVPNNNFVLFLKHRPLVEKDSLGLFDLQLSGHAHKGQIFPFGLITRLYYPIDSGFASLSSGSNLYVSRGTGTWGPPIRFLTPPEITIFDLIHEDQASSQN